MAALTRPAGRPRRWAGWAGRGARRGAWGQVRLVPVLIVTALAFIVGYLQKLPCHMEGWAYRRHLLFGEYCYSDMPVLFRSRGLIAGIFPYSSQSWEHPLEYPVVTGLIMDVTARLTRWLSSGASTAVVSQTYFEVNVLVLLGFAMLVVGGTWALLRRSGAPTAYVLMVAAAPTLVLAGTINWDLVAVACAVLALVAWAYERPLLAGVLIGLGTSAKLFPAFLLGPLLLVCLRQRRIRGFLQAAASAAVAWLVANLPIYLLYPDGWWEFWRFNAEREADFGSIWYALKKLDHPVPPENVNWLATGILAVLVVGIAALAWWAPRPPTLAQLSFLVVTAFLLTNKVYSPQYVLWMLPLAVLARSGVPLRRVLPDWVIWQAGELIYWVVVWQYLAGLSADEAWKYPAATFVRVAATLYLFGRVVHDCLRREPVERREPAAWPRDRGGRKARPEPGRRPEPGTLAEPGSRAEPGTVAEPGVRPESDPLAEPAGVPRVHARTRG